MGIFCCVIILFVLFLSPELKDIEKTNPNDLNINIVEKDSTFLFFYEKISGCNLSGTLILGDFNTTVVNGYYELFAEDYNESSADKLVFYGLTDDCFLDNKNLPFYLEWKAKSILNYSEYRFEAEMDPRSPGSPEAMQGFIRPEDVEERFEKIEIDYEESDLYNLEKIFGSSYMNYVSDMGRFGVSEYWQTPADFIKSKGGDCEDWAIYMESLIQRYNPDIDCYVAVWYTHANLVCNLNKTFIILDQDKIRKNVILDEESSVQENKIAVRSWRNNYFKEYGIDSDKRVLLYLIKNDEIIKFEDGQEDFVDWVLEKGGVL